MKQFSLLLINSAIDNPFVRERYRNAGVFLAPPLGLYRLKSYIENLKLAAVDIFDPNLHRDNVYEALEQKLTKHNSYNIIGFSPTHVNLGYDLNLVWIVYNFYKQKGLTHPLYIAGGNEATNNYQELFNHFYPLSVVVLGPGERPLEAIIRMMQNNTIFSTDFKKIPGTVTNDQTTHKLRYHNANPEDVITFRQMAFENDPTHLIPYRQYWNCVGNLYSQKNLASRSATLRCIRLYTTNHCQMQCNFCTSKAFHKNACGGYDVPVARLTPEQMIMLIKKCWDYHRPDAFYFNDDDLIGNSKNGRKRIMEFCQLMENSRTKAKKWANVTLYCQTQALWLTKMKDGELIEDIELCRMMKRGGFKIVCMGIENLSARLLRSKSIQKSYTPTHAKVAIQGLKKVGITPLINIILFPPEVEEKDLIINIKECGRLISEGVIISMQEFVEIFPGSLLHQDIVNGRCNVETVHDQILIKATGKKVVSNERVLPENTYMRKVANALYSELNKVNKYLLKKPWFSFDVTPKHINALAMLMATARLLDRKEDSIYLEEIAHKICTQNSIDNIAEN